MTASTWTWIGLTSTVDDSSNWSLTSGPGNSENSPQSGDTAIFGGAGVAPRFVDQQLSNNNTIDLTGTGTVQFLNDTGSFGGSGIGSSITIDASGSATSILTEGTFTNGGTIQVNGAGNTLTIDVAADITNSATQAGWFENDGSIFVNQGATLTVTATAGATFAGSGTLFVDGGAALVDAALPTVTNDANFSISQSGSLEITQAGTSAAPNVTFNGPGVLKVDQPGDWGFNGGNAAGTVNGFVAGDTIDLGILNVTSVVYDNNGDIILIGTNGGTVFAVQANSGALSSNGPGTFALAGTGGIAGDVVVTEGNSADTLLTVTPPRTWLWTNGASASAESNNWTVVAGPPGTGGPNQGDTAINAGGTILEGNHFNLNSNTLELGGTASLAAIIPGGATSGGGGGNGPTNFMNPSVDSNSVITNVVTSVGTFVGNSTPETSLFGVAGPFVNEGSIIANGPAGSSFTIAVNDTSVNGTLEAGSFINYKEMQVGPGNAMTIEVGPGSEFFNASEILVDGGTLKVVADPNAIDGGYAGTEGAIVIVGGGTVETNSTFSAQSTATVPIYAFADETKGNTLRIDNIASFGGAIIGFAAGDTIDLGTSVAATALAYNSKTGILNILDSGTIAASLVLGSGDFQSGTTALTGGVAGSFILTTGGDGDSVLTTAVQNDVFSNSSGSWQSSGLWSNGTPGSLGTALIGFNANNSFTLTTGASPVSVGAPIITGGLVRITSATTFGPYPIRQYGGSLEITGGNTLTAAELFDGGGQTTLDPGATLDLAGHVVYGSTGAIDGTIAASAIDPRALALGGGSLLVNGGVLNAGTGQASGDGGASYVGVDGGGTPVNVTVQSNGTNAGVVSDLYTDLGSDPTGFGALTINGGGTAGGATWTDQIDPNETAAMTTGFMVVGYNNQSALAGTVVPTPFSAAATLAVENGATLTEQSYAIIGLSGDSAGSVQVAGGLWNIGTGPLGGFLNAGDSAASSGTLEVDSNGTVAVSHGGTFLNDGTSFNGSGINVGLSAQSSGSITVQNGGLITDGAGLLVGDSGQGTVAVLNGGTIELTGTNGIAVGDSAGGVGSLLVSGFGGSGGGGASLITFGASAKGLSAGAAGQGTVDVESKGTIQMDGTGGFAVGQSANAIGVVIVNGASATVTEGVTANGMSIAGGAGSSGTVTVENGGSIILNGTATSAGIGIGQASGAQGTLNVDGGGTVQMLGGGIINVGQSSGATGLVNINGAGALLNEGTNSTGMTVGQGGSGTLLVGNGGAFTMNSRSGQLRIGLNGAGLVEVSGSNSRLTLNTPNMPNNVVEVGQSAQGTLEVSAGGTVMLDNTLEIGSGATGTGSVSVSGAGSTLTVTGGASQIEVGSPGTGVLDINSSGAVNAANNSVNIGAGSAGTGTVSLESQGSLDAGFLNIANGPSVGGTALLSIAGGAVTASSLFESQGGTITLSSGELSVGGATIGQNGTGAVMTQSGGLASMSGLTVGAGGSGSVTVSGGLLTASGLVIVGQQSGGVLTVDTGGSVVADGGLTLDGSGISGSGSLAIDGGALADTGGVTLGTGGTATMTIGGGGSLIANGNGIGISQFDVGNAAGGNASLTVGGGLLNVTNQGLFIGDGGNGSMLVDDGGDVSTSSSATGPSVDVNATGGNVASAKVVGADSRWELTSSGEQFVIGDTGDGSVAVSSGGVINAGSNKVDVGNQSQSAGTITVSSGGTMSAAASSAQSPAFDVGAASGATGAMTVTGLGSRVNATGQITVGDSGIGDLLISNQATVQSGGAVIAPTEGIVIGQSSGGSGVIAVAGTLSVLTNSGQFIVGNNGLGSLSIAAGGAVTTTPGALGGITGLEIAANASASGSAVNVSGAGSGLTVTGMLDVGDNGSGSLSLSQGATVSAGSLDAANVAAAVGQISLSGAGTELLVTNSATVADDGTGVLSVLSGATFAASSLTIGSQGDSSGAVVVSGNGSQINLSGALNIGTANGTGDLTVGPGAAIQAQAVIQQGQVVLEGGLLDPTVQLINQGQTAGGFGTIAAGDIVDEGAIQAGGNKASQKLLIVQGTVLGGGILTVDGTQAGSVPAGIMQINAGGTLELSGAVLNSAATTFTDNLTPQGTYTVNNSVIDVNFVDSTGVLLLDDIAGFAGTITTYQAGDKFVISGGTLSGVIVSNGDTLLVSDTGPNAGPDGIDSIIFNAPVNPLGFKVVNGNTVEAQALPCFAAGTRIETEHGPVAVEDLCIGDRVVLADGRAPEPIVWIGQRTVNCRAHPKPENVWPVRVRAGALGRNVPVRDVYLSPDHAVFVNGVLVPAKLLVNGTGITQVARAVVTYFHLELPGHAVILAEGLPVESYLDTGDRTDFRGGEAMRLFPDFVARIAPETALLWETRGAAKLVLSGPALEAARRMVGDGDAPGTIAPVTLGQRLPGVIG